MVDSREMGPVGIATLAAVVALTVGVSSGLAAGEIVAWGSNDRGQCNIPEPNAGFTAVEGGYLHSLALREDGTIAAWGDNSRGQCVVPAPNADFSDVSAKGYHSLALRTDGSIAAWGDNANDQCDVPLPNTGYTAIAAGGYHSLAMRPDGSVVAWGNNGADQCDVPEPNGGYVAIAAGYYHSLGLRGDGAIEAWGDNDYGQCNIPEPNSGFVAIVAGGYFSLGLRGDGSIVAWGGNAYGQGDVPEPNLDFVLVAAGAYHSVGLKGDGSTLAWGRNVEGQCNLPSPEDHHSVLAAGGFHSLAIRGALFGLQVVDVPEDQGGVLRATWNRHSNDDSADPLPIIRYEVQVDEGGDWSNVAIVEASGAVSYSVDFATSDVLIIGHPEPYSIYRVVAITTDPEHRFVSETVHAYSIDNLAPPQPQVQFYEFDYAVVLAWAIPEIPDFAEACVYRGTTIDFVPGEPIACTTDPGYAEELTTMVYYRVQFADTHGNVGEFSEVVYPTATAAIADVSTPGLYLRECYPNPFNPRTTVEFTIPAAGHVALEIFDARGRNVAGVVDERLESGFHRYVWVGADNSGDPLPSGCYFCRLTTPWGVESRSMVLVR